MRTVTLSKWSIPALVAILAALFALALTVQPAQAVATTTVQIKQGSLALGDNCVAGSTTGAHIVITQIGSAAPATISVSLSDGSTVIVPRSRVTGGTAHYDVPLSGQLVTGAT